MSMSLRAGLFLSATALAAAVPALVAQQPAPYTVASRIPLPGEGGWDYLIIDAAARRLYVSHATKIDVIDLNTNAPLGAVEGLTGAHGGTAAGGHIFATSGRTDEVVVADAKTFAVTDRLKTGAKPDAILYDAASGRVFSFNGDGQNATAIDAATAKVVGTIPLGGAPEFAAPDGKGHVFVNIEDKGELVEFDAKKLEVLRRVKLEGCDEPTGLAIDRSRDRLFSVCHNKVMVIVDSKSLKLLQTLPIGSGVDGAAADSVTGAAFASNGDGTITMVVPDGKAYSVKATIPSAPRARTIALDPMTRKIYVATAEFGEAPAPTEKEPRPRPPMKPGTFAVVVMEPAK
jgi:DNA-binding beta-propeller fold protein YncE